MNALWVVAFGVLSLAAVWLLYDIKIIIQRGDPGQPDSDDWAFDEDGAFLDWATAHRKKREQLRREGKL